MKRTIWLTLLLFILVGRTLAQADCPAIVETALQTTAEACTALSRNQACYGNVMLEAEAHAGAEFTFEQTGDIASLSDIAALHLSPMDAKSWGVALLLTQANLPDTLPGQNVTMVLFGEVDMTSAVPTEPEITPEPRPIVFIVTASSSINVRSAPSTSDAVVASLNTGETLPTDGRTEDGAWLRVILPDETVGWVFAELVSVDGDISQLRTLNGDEPIATEATPEAEAEAPTYAPMQAFYFGSSIGDSTCAEAPDSGILIQTPQGVGTINLLVNEVEITLGSTAYLTAGDGMMTVSVIEGQGTVSALGTTVGVPAGTQARIPIDDNNRAIGTPLGPEPYNTMALNALPIVLLPETVTVATSLTQDEIAAIGLQEGNWVFSYVHSNCVETYSFTVPVLYDADQRDYPFVLFDFSVLDFIGWLQTIMNAAFADGVRVPGEYHVETSGYIFDITVVSSTYIEGSGTFPDAACTYTYEFTLTAGEMPETGALQDGSWTLTGSYTSDCPTEPIDFTLNLSVSGNVFTGPDNGIDYRVLSQVEIINQAIQSRSVNVPGNYVSESGDESYMRAITLNILSSTGIEMTIVDTLGSFNCTENYALVYTANG